MMEHYANHPMGLVHLIMALAAIAFGTTIIFSRKGTAIHRWLGRGYLVTMLAVNGTALLIYELFGRFGPFHWMALASLAVVLVGYWPARRRTPGWRVQHAYFMTGSYVGLLAALASEISTRARILPFFDAVALVSLVVIGLGVWLMRRWLPGILSGQR